jgi:rare lipoprotein A
MKLHWQAFAFFMFSQLSPQKRSSQVSRPADTVVQTIFTSYYAKKFEGRKTTSGEKYRGKKYTAAHRTLPFGTMVTVKNLVNRKGCSGACQ